MDEKEKVEDPYSYANKYCMELGLPKDFLEILIKEDDWSCVIKSFSLCEIALTHALSIRLCGKREGLPVLENLTAHILINISSQIGDIFTAENIKKMMWLKKLRNNLAHDIRNTKFTFQEYFKNLDEINEFKSIFASGWDPEMKATICENPKWTIASFIIDLLVDVYCIEKNTESKEIYLKMGKSWSEIIISIYKKYKK